MVVVLDARVAASHDLRQPAKLTSALAVYGLHHRPAGEAQERQMRTARRKRRTLVLTSSIRFLEVYMGRE
jgi:hypothetical protein